MGEVANILDARPLQKSEAAGEVPHTARLIPGQGRFHPLAGSAVNDDARSPGILPALLKRFPPAALGSALLDFGLITLVFASDRLGLQLYLPARNLGLFLCSFAILAITEGLYADPATSLRRQFQLAGKCVSWSIFLTVMGAGSAAYVSRLLLLSAYSFCGLCAARQLIYFLSDQTRAQAVRNVLIVGHGPHVENLANAIASTPGYTARKIVSEPVLRRRGCGLLGWVARRNFIENVVIATDDPEIRAGVIREAVRNQLEIQVAPELPECTGAHAVLHAFHGIPLLHLNWRRSPEWMLAVKRVVDVVVAGLALPLLVPAFLLIAIAVFLDSGGPIFYCAPTGGKERCTVHLLEISHHDGRGRPD